MTNPVVRITETRRARDDLPKGTVLDSDDDSQWQPDGRGCWIWCPGCQEAHRPRIVGADGTKPEGPVWEWNGRDDEHFGIEPSLLVGVPGSGNVCHSFIRDGWWEFLDDCTHELAGQTVPMIPLPDWLAER